MVLHQFFGWLAQIPTDTGLVGASVASVALISGGIAWYVESSIKRQLLAFQVTLFKHLSEKFAGAEELRHLRDRVERHLEMNSGSRRLT